ncbi:MAG: Holliday junction branch migration protein RuvA [Anaerolineae bacterium]|jgi:Holliday junction DNA helicase RuvA|nr:MAG: Holliday junction branch migration protein RuvA [Anaerolineae bacterium]
MIASISGIVREIETDTLVVENQGIGYLVYVPRTVCEHARIGEQIFLFTQLLVREDSLTLVGFETIEARKLFNLLISVNGVGYKLALSVLSTLSGDALRGAIAQNQVEVLARVPGLGRKTAQKIILTLQDKIQTEGDWGQFVAFRDTDEEVLAALTSLGYSVVEAQAAIQSIPRDTPPELETRLRLALSYFSKTIS